MNSLKDAQNLQHFDAVKVEKWKFLLLTFLSFTFMILILGILYDYLCQFITLALM